MENDLREDYEIGMSENGELLISYCGECSCGFKFKYNHKEKIDLAPFIDIKRKKNSRDEGIF